MRIVLSSRDAAGLSCGDSRWQLDRSKVKLVVVGRFREFVITMKHLKLTTTLFVLFLLSGLEINAQQKSRWLSYEPVTVELEGRLTVQSKYGPPNYGENPRTDARVKVPILVLVRPINVRGTPGEAHNAISVRGTRRIQLVFSNRETSYKQSIGEIVVVKGSLFHAISGHHYTDVVMDVRAIEAKQTFRKTRKRQNAGERNHRSLSPFVNEKTEFKTTTVAMSEVRASLCYRQHLAFLWTLPACRSFRREARYTPQDFRPLCRSRANAWSSNCLCAEDSHRYAGASTLCRRCCA